MDLSEETLTPLMAKKENSIKYELLISVRIRQRTKK